MDSQANSPRPRAWQLAVVITIISAVSACLLLSLGALILVVPSESSLGTEYSMSALICFVPGLIALVAGVGTWRLFLRGGRRIRLGADFVAWIAALSGAFLLLEGVVIMVQSGPAQPFRFQPSMLPASALFCLAPALALAWLAYGIRLFANRPEISRGRAIGILLTGILAVLFLGLGVLFSMPTRDGVLVPLTSGDAAALVLCGLGPAFTLVAIAMGLWMSAGWTRKGLGIASGQRRGDTATRGQGDKGTRRQGAANVIRDTVSSIPRPQFPTIGNSQLPPATDPPLPIDNAQLSTSSSSQTIPQGLPGVADHRPQATDPVRDFISHLASGDYLVITFDHAGEAIEDARRVVMENAVGFPSQIFTADRQPAGILATADRAILVVGGLDSEAVNRITLAAGTIKGASVQEQGRR